MSGHASAGRGRFGKTLPADRFAGRPASEEGRGTLAAPIELALKSPAPSQVRLSELHVDETMYVHPTEAHVAASAQHNNLPIVVNTIRGTWRVVGADVFLIAAK